VCPWTRRESSPHTTPFLGIVSSFSQWVGAQGLGYAKVASFIVLSAETGIKCFGAAFWKMPIVECWPFLRAHAQGDSQANEDRAYV